MTSNATKSVVLAAAIGLAAGYLIAGVPGFDPVNPFYPKRPDRPVLSLLSRVARLGLWVMVFADPPEDKNPAVQACAPGEFICHAEGW